MKPIETLWKGYRFRSRTEARWAVFLEAVGLVFEYEPEGVILPSGPYLPDFRIQGFPNPHAAAPETLWLEVKGTVPDEDELRRCSELATASGQIVLLAVGAPDFREQLYIFDHNLEEDIRTVIAMMAGPYTFANVGAVGDVRIGLARAPGKDFPEFEATAPEAEVRAATLNRILRSDCKVLGAGDGPLPEATIHLTPEMKSAYDKARSARFEFGDTEGRWSK